MKKITFVISLFLLSSSVFAWTIGPMNYQGRLLDNAGVPVTGSYNFKVRIYDAASGGLLKFSEQHNSVAVDDGVYSFLVSTGTNSTGTWDIALWNTPTLYLEIEVNGETLTPRHLLASAPFAYQANLALTTNNALALGGKSATEYNNTLAAICESSKGKWLDKVEKCLGVGSSFPGPTLAHWGTLATDSNFSNLDLSRADISGIDFNGTDLSSSIFVKTTYSVAGLTGVNLKDTYWDSAISADIDATKVDGTVLAGASMRNMSLAHWNMSNVTLIDLKGFSAAAISACPEIAPDGWECRTDGLGGSNYFLLGPGVNLSASSAAAESRFGASYLKLGQTALNNMDLNGATFEGNTLTQDFVNVNLDNVNFNYTVFRSNYFEGCHLEGTTFVSSLFDKPVISDASTNYFINVDFTNADISFARFLKTISGANFTKATLRNVYFVSVDNGNFTKAVLDQVTIYSGGGQNTFDGTRFYHGFTYGTGPYPYNIDNSQSVFKDLTFVGGTLKGDFSGALFTGSLLFDGVASSSGLDICGATFPLVGGVVPGWSIGMGAECPDGADYTPCNVSPHMNPIPVAQCTVGMP